MAAMWESVRSTFWNEWFWLPPRYTWKDLENHDDGIYRAQVSDMLVTLPLAALLLVLRALFERYIAAPIGRHYGLRQEKVKQAPHNPYLEKIFRQNKTPDKNDFEGMSKQTDLSTRQVERWFRLRRMQNRISVLYRFTESSWRCCFYFIIFWYGVVVLWDKSWFWNTLDCWRGYPDHNVPTEIYWYYALEGGFYLSLLVSQFKDVKRKDFFEMFIHHLVTLSLMFLSWSQNLIRIGTLVLVIHDAVDPLLEAAKMAKYLNWQKTCDAVFFIFFLVWILTRMIIFPVRLVYTTLFESTTIVGMCSIYFLYSTLLIMLQILHVFWFVIISRIVYKAVKKGNIARDERSSTEEEISDDDNSVTKTDIVANSNGLTNETRDRFPRTNGRLERNGLVPLSNNNQNKVIKTM